jgi:hypothetical protein
LQPQKATACLRIHGCQHIWARDLHAFQFLGAGFCKPSKLGFSTRFPLHFIRHETRPSSFDFRTYTITPQQHTTPHFNSKQQHELKWPAVKVRSPPSSSRRAARARKDVPTDTFFTGKTGGKTGGKAGGDSTGKTQKSHSAKAGLQVRCGMRFFEMGRKRVQAAAMDLRASTVCAQSLRADKLHATAI